MCAGQGELLIGRISLCGRRQCQPGKRPLAVQTRAFDGEGLYADRQRQLDARECRAGSLGGALERDVQVRDRDLLEHELAAQQRQRPPGEDEGPHRHAS